MINRLKHHPSIVIWVLHNEGWGQFDTQRLTDRITFLDPTRLVNAVSGWKDIASGDLADAHDYSEQPAVPTGDAHRAKVIGEYGGIGWPIEAHVWDAQMRNWGYQTYHTQEEVMAAYTKVNSAIIQQFQSAGLAGAIYTQTSDIEGEVNGLLTYDREIEKFPRDWLAREHAPLTGDQ